MSRGKDLLFLAALNIFLLLALTAIYQGGTAEPVPEYEMMTRAAQQFEQAAEVIRTERLARGLPLDREDTLQIGLLGTELSPITTTLGDVAAKRTSQISDMAALCVRLLSEAGVKPGGKIGACMSGSFPGLNIALLCACQAMDVEVVYTASVGASTYGANLSEFTSPEMLLVLCDAGILPTPPASVSAGGDYDSGTNMLGRLLDEQAVIDQTLARVRRAGVNFVCWPDLAENVAYHAELYGDIDCFVNVGGTVVGSGANYVVLGLGQGVLNEPGIKYQTDSGLLEYYLAGGVPTVQLLNVKQLCLEYGIPFDPAKIPEVGTTGVYYQKSYPKGPLTLTGLLAITSLIVFSRKKRDKNKFYAKNAARKE